MSAYLSTYKRPNWWAPQTSGNSLLMETASVWTVLRRNRRVVFISIAASFIAGLLVAALETPLFRAQALLEAQNVNDNFLRLSDYEPTSSVTTNGSFLTTQTRLLQSEALAAKVARNTKLAENPSFFLENRRLMALKRLFHLNQASRPHTLPETVSRFRNSVRARIEGDSNLISIETEAADPELAAKLSNALASQYITDELDDRAKSALQTSEWLSRQLDDVRVRFQNSERALQDYAGASGLLFFGENSTFTDEELRQIQEELSRARAARAQEEADMRLIASAPADTLPKILDDGPMKEYLLRRTDLRRQIADLRTTLTPEHYKVKRLEAEAAVIDQAIEARRTSVLKRIKNEYESGIQRENLLQKAYSDQAKVVTNDLTKAIRYNVLKGEVETNRQLYGTMMQRAKEASMLSAIRTSSLRLVQPAQAPVLPFRPNFLESGTLGILVGLLLSTFLVLIRERLDCTFRRRGEIFASLAVPELGVIPAARMHALTPFSSRTLRAGNGQFLHITRHSEDSEPNSLFTEAFHCAATSLTAAQRKGGEVFLISSPQPQAGKSIVVANLGKALARIDRQGIVIDGDFRRPTLHSFFGLASTPGLAEILKSEEPVPELLNASIQETCVSGLTLLSAGRPSPLDWRLLQVSRIEEVLAELRKRFNFVLIDSPPMLHFPEGRILGRLADSVLLVCRAGHTRSDQLAEAVRLCSSNGSRLAGTILNDWDVMSEDPKSARLYQSYYRGSV